MNENRPLHVVVGATGGTGSAIVRELVRRGHHVRAVSRGGRPIAPPPPDVPSQIEHLVADVATDDGAMAAAAGAAVVYHAAQPAYTRWPEEFPAMTAAIIDGVAAAGAKLVFADNLYLYGPTDGPLTETTPLWATSRKGRTRIQMTEQLLAAHRSGRVRVAIGRSSDYYGPGGTASIAGETLFGSVLAGKPVRWPGSLDQPHTFSYLDDIASALVTLGERTEADGEAWHLPAAAPLTARRFIELVFAGAGMPAKMRALPKVAVRAAGLFVPYAREATEIWYQVAQPFVSDAAKFQRAFGPLTPTAHPVAIAHTLDWFRDRRR